MRYIAIKKITSRLEEQLNTTSIVRALGYIIQGYRIVRMK